MPANDNSAIFDYHRSMIAFHGNTSTAALGWRDPESQLIRFKVLCEIANMDDCTVLDAGCGHGDLLAYLFTTCQRLQYTGIEQIPELLEEAERRYGFLPGARFLKGDFIHNDLPLSDYVLASGSLNYCQEDPEFIYKAIARLYGSCRMGLGFNLLRHVIPNGLLAAYDPDTIMSYCETLCERASLRMDYSEEDFTVFMYH